MKSAPHPSAEQLRDFVQGRMPPHALTTVETHLADCPSCCAALESLPDDALVSIIRAAGRSSDSLTLHGTAATTPLPRPASEGPPRVPGYEILGELGRGGMGVVYKAKQLGLGRTVALKMLLAGSHADVAQVARFRGEGEAVGRLRHPNVVQVYDTGVCQGLPYFALEYVEHGSLAARARGVPQPPGESAALVEVLARAVAAAHAEGIVHRDLKPANILLTTDGAPKITDFGLAKWLQQADGLTHTGTVVGTPAYMAPEQASGRSRDVGPEADIYSLGAILYELLTGRPPFQGSTPLDTLYQVCNADPVPPGQLVARLPRDLETICLKCLEKEPSRRYATAAALADDLGRFKRGEPTAARAVGLTGRAWKWARRHPSLAALMALTALALLAGAAISGYFAVEADRRAREAVGLAGEKQQALDLARAARRDSDRRAAELLFREGIAQCEGGAVAQGMFTLVDAWQLAPEDTEFRRVIRTNLDGWRWHLPALRDAVTAKGDFQIALADPEGNQFATWIAAETQLWDTATGAAVGPPTRAGSGEQIESVLADGRLYLKGSDGRKFLRAGGADTPLPEWTRGLGGVRIDPFGGAKGGGDSIAARQPTPAAEPVLFWQLGSTAKPFEVTYGKDHVHRVFTDRDGRAVLALFHTADATKIELWDLQSGKKLSGFEPRPGGADPWASWDGRTILSVSSHRVSMYNFPMAFDGSVRWWDPRTGAQAAQPWRPRRVAWYSTLSGDGSTLAEWGVDRRLRLYDLATGLQRGGDMPSHPAHSWHQHFAPTADGGTLLSADAHGTVRLWDARHLRPQASAASNSRLTPVPRRGPEHPPRAAFSPDGRTAVVCSTQEGGLARLVDVGGSLPRGQPLPHRHLFSPTWSPDGKWVTTLSHNHAYGGTPVARVWDAATGKPRTGPLVNPRFLHSAAFSPDGGLLALGGPGGTILWDAKAGKPLKALGEETAVSRLLFAADGRTLAVGCRNGWPGVGAGVRLWDAQSGKPLGDFVATREHVFWLTFADNGRTLLALTISGEVCRLDATTGRPLAATVRLNEVLLAGAFSPDGSRVATANLTGVVRQWDTTTGRPVSADVVLPQPALSVDYSPDGRTLATLCEDGTVRLWDRATALPLGPPLMPRSTPLAAAFSPDGASVLTVTDEGRTYAWPVPVPVADDRARAEVWLRATTGTERRRGEVELLSADEWRALRGEAWRSAPDALTWHETRARDAEEDGNTTAALRHLDRLLELRSDDWSIHARKGRAFTQVGAFEQAATAYARAEALRPEETHNWYQQRIAATRLRNQAKAMRWYAERFGKEGAD